MHGATPKIYRELRHQVGGYLDTFPDESSWLAAAKLLLTRPMALYLKGPVPNGGTPFTPTGSLKSWMRNRLNVYNHKNTHLWFSWLQAKRAALPASDQNVQENYSKHFETLSRAPTGAMDVINRVFLNRDFQRVLRDVQRKLAGSLREVTYSASVSACFERTRSRGGAQKELSDLAKYYSDLERYKDAEFVISAGSLKKMRFKPGYVNKNGFAEFGSYAPVRDYDPSMERGWKEMTSTRQCILNGLTDLDFLEDTEFREAVKDLTCHDDCLCQVRRSTNLPCTIQGVIEPFKVRVISKGPALPYYAVKGLQKALHGVIRKFPCFELTGSEVDPTVVVPLSKLSREGDVWHSVDYSAATDGLDIRYSEKILEVILRKTPPHLQQLARKVLGPHFLHYPSSDGKVEFKGTQANGQLMGSPLSFPILCLANLGLYLDTTQQLHHEREFTLRQRLQAALINGDDLLFSGPPSLGVKHAETGEEVGLKQTVGKSYCHPRYANINSLSIDCKMGSNHPRAIPFFNVGLFFGQNKVLGEVDPREGPKLAQNHDHETPKEFTPYMNKLIGGMLESQRNKFLAIFLRNHADGVNSETKSFLKFSTPKGKISKVHHRNIFLPQSLGGMGVQKPKGFRSKITLDDKRVAQILLAKKGSVASQRPLPGFAPNPQTDDIDPWKVPEVKPKSLVFRTSDDLSKPSIGSLSKFGLALPYLEYTEALSSDALFGTFEQWEGVILG
jgi:hypothetical protein